MLLKTCIFDPLNHMRQQKTPHYITPSSQRLHRLGITPSSSTHTGKALLYTTTTSALTHKQRSACTQIIVHTCTHTHTMRTHAHTHRQTPSLIRKERRPTQCCSQRCPLPITWRWPHSSSTRQSLLRNHCTLFCLPSLVVAPHTHRAAEDIPRADEVRALMKDIWDLRIAKLRKSIDYMITHQETYGKVCSKCVIIFPLTCLYTIFCTINHLLIKIPPTSLLHISCRIQSYIVDFYPLPSSTTSL